MLNELPPEAAARPTGRPGLDPHRRPQAPADRRWRRRAGAFGVVGVAALIAAGCGSSSKTSTPAAAPATAAPTTAAAAPTTGAAPATSAASTAGAASKTGTMITATLTEFKIALSPSSFTPGTYTFHAVNAGHTVHALEIDGPGVEDQKTAGNLQPGQSANLTVTLKDGKYDVYCPVGDHKALGMNLEVTVPGSATAAAASSPTTAASGGGSGY
jgi:uncharacterized cupredoxin-like copper-binding protein